MVIEAGEARSVVTAPDATLDEDEEELYIRVHISGISAIRNRPYRLALFERPISSILGLPATSAQASGPSGFQAFRPQTESGGN